MSDQSKKKTPTAQNVSGKLVDRNISSRITAKLISKTPDLTDYNIPVATEVDYGQSELSKHDNQGKHVIEVSDSESNSNNCI